MRLILTAAVAASVALSSPALADEPYAVTPSGATEALFAMPIVETSDFLANRCVDLGWQMVSSTDTTVVCEVPVSFGSKLLSALAAPRYSTPPRQFFRFNLAGIEGNTRVQASSWQEIQTAFGQTQRTDLVSENYHNSVMTFFAAVGGVYPQGTIFPNHALAGFRFEAVESPEKGLRIIELTEGGAFDRAGLLVNDIVLRIARERTKGHDDLLDGLHKAVREPTYEVQFYRDGAKHEVQVEREYRSEISERLPPLEPVEAEEAGPTQIVPPLSAADELAKFAKLRDDGVITEEEFAEQKARLLGSVE